MLLELEDIIKNFGGLHVLSEVSFSVNEGEIVRLIGPNGAGKTTLFNVITGIYRPEEGSIQFHGKNIVGLKPHRICRRGIARTFQLVRIFPSMTVLENVMVGSIYGNRCAKKQGRKEALECLEILNLIDVKDAVTSHLTFSDRRLVEIARAIAAKPGLALLDEPLAGLNPTETRKIMTLIREIRETQWSTLFFFDIMQAASVPYEALNAMSDADRPKKLAILMEDTIDGRAFGGAFKAQAEKYGYKFAVDEPLAVGAKDYSSQILKLKTKKVDGILIFGADGDCVTFVRQMKEAGLNVKYFHGYKGTWAHEFYNALGPDADGVLMDGFWSEDLPYTGAKELGTRYAKQFGKHSVSTGLYYALCQILWEAIEKAGSLDSAKTKEAVLTHEFQNTVLEHVKYNKETNTAIHLLRAFQWHEGYQEVAFPALEEGWKVQAVRPWNKR